MNREAGLLIDADNLSLEGMAQALQRLRELDFHVTVRRAYGSHETLGTVREFLAANSIRAIVNQGKGTTDAALVVDAMDLLHGNGLPQLMAIGSGDGDFAPLVVRLREAGIRVLCFAQKSKAPKDLDRVYDEVIDVDAPAPAKRAAAARKTPAKKAPARKAAAPAPASDSDRVWDVLEAVPGFMDGEEVALNDVVKKLRDLQLMSKSTSARNFFKKHAPHVEVLSNTLRLPPGQR
jgi:hypothetical protein